MNIDYEAQMRLQDKKKSRKQLVSLIITIGILAGVLYFFYGWQQGNGKKNFENLAKQTLNSVYENYKEDKMWDDNLEDKTYIFPDNTIINFTELTLKGGSIIQYGNGDVAFAIYDDKWCAIKRKEVSTIDVTEYKEGNCVIK